MIARFLWADGRAEWRKIDNRASYMEAWSIHVLPPIKKFLGDPSDANVMPVRRVTFRRERVLFEDDWHGPLETDDFSWHSTGNRRDDREFWLWRCARLWWLESLAMCSAEVYAAALHDHLYGYNPARYERWREVGFMVEPGCSALQERFS